jgi:hypothetical protein
MTDSDAQKTYIKLELKSRIARLYYFAYSVAANNYFPQHNYTEVLNAQREIQSTLHNLIYLGISQKEEGIQSELIKELDKINVKLNKKLINMVNEKNASGKDGHSNLYSTSGFLPNIDEPLPISLKSELTAYN